MKKVIALAAFVALFGAAAHAYLGEVLASWQTPGTYPSFNGIAFEGEYIWLNDGAYETKGVFKCTKAGSVIKEIGFPYHGWGPACGMAFDGEYLWTADKNTPQYIYKVDIDVVDVAPASVGRVKALYR